MEVILVRHGETAGNAARQWSGGGTDEPLTPAGVAGAKATRTGLAPEKVYVSPMLRARQTASLLFPSAEQTVVEGLREMHFGRFEGKSHEQLKDDPAYQAFIGTNMNVGSPGGETLPAFTERVCGAFSRLVEQAAARGERRVVIVAHGGTLMALMRRYAYPNAGEDQAWHAENCRGWRGNADPATWGSDPKLTGVEPFPE